MESSLSAPRRSGSSMVRPCPSRTRKGPVGIEYEVVSVKYKAANLAILSLKVDKEGPIMRRPVQMIAIAALGVAVTVSAVAQQKRGALDVPPDQCPVEGTAKPQAGKVLNRLKNRTVAPHPDQIDRAVTLEAMLAPGEDEGRFDEQKGAIITGWVVNVEQGGQPETANCGS